MECGGSAKLGGGQEEVGIAKHVVGSSWCQLGAGGQRAWVGTLGLVSSGLLQLFSFVTYTVLRLPYCSILEFQGPRTFGALGTEKDSHAQGWGDWPRQGHPVSLVTRPEPEFPLCLDVCQPCGLRGGKEGTYEGYEEGLHADRGQKPLCRAMRPRQGRRKARNTTGHMFEISSGVDPVMLGLGEGGSTESPASQSSKK